jgi:hypothetical protein
MSEINFDKSTFNGKTNIIGRIYEKLDQKSVIFNVCEYKGCVDHMSKINYLSSLGIQNNNTSGDYDFSHIKDKNISDNSFENDSLIDNDTVDDDLVLEDEEIPELNKN